MTATTTFTTTNLDGTTSTHTMEVNADETEITLDINGHHVAGASRHPGGYGPLFPRNSNQPCWFDDAEEAAQFLFRNHRTF